ncbi:NADH-quinone oxidoreductase subunit L [Gorillibacterium sp. sgz5001074]|uniref:NADH-quinone oxidoreductase subunit L n=1 Tax=Gorillibacterium sp. sgz5001074 TaxID=3446695 RepID=UPI003F676111
MEFSQLAWLVPVFPLLAFIVLTAFGRQARTFGVYTGITLTGISLVLSVLIFFERLGHTQDYTWNDFEWLKFGDTALRFGYEVTNLNALMLVVVTLVSFLVNIYSSGYMQDDERITVFFGYISLFTFSMLGLVISSNLLQLYVFWELVGVCSFLLVGFWYHKPEARAAAKKAFIVTRIGDVGLFIGILLLFWYMPEHRLDFSAIHNAFQGTPAIEAGIVTWIGVLIFIGAMGKSGQFPLHTWLPDAMEGPTPISALIHAATMVAAGVYLVARTYDIFLASDTALLVVTVVGAFTALFAATIGTAQNDIKRILAYSTVSQLGYMMMALGLGTWAAYTAGIFHLFTHAFFKALLFLGAGSVIHAVHTQNIHEMGGVGRHMKITAWTFAIGTLALSGVFPLSGFWSKDAILAEAYHSDHMGVFIVGLIGAFFTAFYMSRLFFLVFTGKSRSHDHSGHGEPHESPLSMTLPLLVLAVLAVVAGFVFVPGMNNWFGEWLAPGHEAHEAIDWTVVLLSNLMAIAGIALGWLIYAKQSIRQDLVTSGAPWLYKLLNRKYYIDELYQTVIVAPLSGLAMLLAVIDEFIIDGCVRLVAAGTGGIGQWGRRVQNGQVQTYGLVTVLSIVILVLAFAGRRYFHVG